MATKFTCTKRGRQETAMWGPWDLPNNAKIHFTPEKLELQKSHDTVCLMIYVCHGHHLPSSQRKPASVFWKISTRLSVFRWTCIAISPFSLSEETDISVHNYTDKKENKIFLINKEIQSGAVAKSYVRKGFLINKEMRKYLPIYEKAVRHI